MRPDQPQQPAQSQTTAAPPVQPASPPTMPLNNHKRTVSALWLIIWPTALLVVTIVLTAASNYFLSGIPGDSDMFGNRNSLQAGVNTVLSIIGVVAVVALLPSLITGVVLLATRKK